ncbi:hypothetical protein HON22_04735 [Candidatus Peregrinibacteria bacterium]|jgi:hypothetical protein|nr:hypothetical protein [Candidatus Peregrinibacteria bacterium]
MNTLDPSFIEALKNWLNAGGTYDMVIKGVLIYVAFFWIALIIWVTRDVINRSNNIVFQVAIILLNTFLPIFGLVIYLLIRPTKTLLDKYYDELEIKALLDNDICHKCSSVLRDDYCFCPECSAAIKSTCGSCKKNSLLDHNICPFCGEKKELKTKKKKALKIHVK